MRSLSFPRTASQLASAGFDAAIWQELHDAAVKYDRVSELAFAYESAAHSRKLKTFLPAVQGELFFRAAPVFGDVLGDEFGATTYLEKALGACPGHAGAFERIDAQLTRIDDNKKLAELCVQTASHRPRPDQRRRNSSCSSWARSQTRSPQGGSPGTRP